MIMGHGNTMFKYQDDIDELVEEMTDRIARELEIGDKQAEKVFNIIHGELSCMFPNLKYEYEVNIEQSKVN